MENKAFEYDPELAKFGDYKKFMEDWRAGIVCNVSGRVQNALLEMEQRIKELEKRSGEKNNERKYFAISLKHQFPFKIGDRLCLWGTQRTKDEEPRCYSGYTGKINKAELYTIKEFLTAYHYHEIYLDSPVLVDRNLWMLLKKKYDTIFVSKEEVEKYYKMCDLI